MPSLCDDLEQVPSAQRARAWSPSESESESSPADADAPTTTVLSVLSVPSLPSVPRGIEVRRNDFGGPDGVGIRAAHGNDVRGGSDGNTVCRKRSSSRSRSADEHYNKIYASQSSKKNRRSPSNSESGFQLARLDVRRSYDYDCDGERVRGGGGVITSSASSRMERKTTTPLHIHPDKQKYHNSDTGVIVDGFENEGDGKDSSHPNHNSHHHSKSQSHSGPGTALSHPIPAPASLSTNPNPPALPAATTAREPARQPAKTTAVKPTLTAQAIAKAVAHPTSHFDPWNSSSTGHQRAENWLGGSTSWRESRNLKLGHQYRGGLSGGAGRVCDTVGAGSADFGVDGWRENGVWVRGAKGLRPGGQRSLMEVWGARKCDVDPVQAQGQKKWDMKVEGASTTSLHNDVDTQGIDNPDVDDNEEKESREPPQIFTHLTFYLNGSTGSSISDHHLKHLIATRGGKLSISLRRRTITHVILGTTGADGRCGGGLAASKIQKEVSRVGGKGVKFVSVEWVLECVRRETRVPETGLRLGSELRIVPAGQRGVGEMFAGKGS